MSYSLEQHEEILLRMKLLGLNPEIIEAFGKHEDILVSDGIGSFRRMNPQEEEIFHSFIDKYPTALPFHIISNNNNRANDDMLLTILQCSAYPEDWDLERHAIANSHCVSAYVYNLSVPDYTESSMVRVSNALGALFLM